MKEKEFIKIIQSTLQSEHIGDDCAYLQELGIVITQDNLVEDVHFATGFISPFELGYKSAMVNLSDIAASGAEPAYLTVGLSLPGDTTSAFVKEFYEGMKKACGGVKIAGGDITGGCKIFVSVAAVGKMAGRRISSRSHAAEGYKIAVSGFHGSSAAGLRDLTNGIRSKFAKAHLMPEAQLEFSRNIASRIQTDYAMMDTSDGLFDALLQIAEASSVKMSVEFDKIPYDKDLRQYDNFRDLVLYGGEDYQLVACVPKDFAIENEFVIGEVKSGKGVEIDSKIIRNPKLYNHFA